MIPESRLHKNKIEIFVTNVKEIPKQNKNNKNHVKLPKNNVIYKKKNKKKIKTMFYFSN